MKPRATVNTDINITKHLSEDNDDDIAKKKLANLEGSTAVNTKHAQVCLNPAVGILALCDL